MALLQMIKEKLGFGTGRTERDERNAEVTVESEPAAEGDDSEGADPVAAEAEAAASTESVVDGDPTAEDGDAAADEAEAEPAEDAAAGADDVAVDADDVGTDVEEVKGIGPAYAERLAEIGIETVEDLAAADAEAVAEEASVGEKRAATWIDRASEF